MYLSRLFLNPQRRGARFLLANPQAMHAAVMSAFPPDRAPGTAAARTLWRVDRTDTSTALYVLSGHEPDLQHIVEQAGWAGSNWESKDYRALLDILELGQHWRFRLRANPVKQLNEPGRRGRRVPHVTVAHQQQWLLDRAERHGFSVEADSTGEHPLVVSDRIHTAFGRKDPRQGMRPAEVTLAMATFEGILRVDDPELLRATLTGGIGRAKAYGCGLMTLVPIGVRHA